VGEEVLESLASFEAAFDDLSKRVAESGWQLVDTDTVDVLKRLAAVSSKAVGVQAQVVRQVETRGIADSLGATSLRTFVMGALRLSPAEAGRVTRLSTALTETCTATAGALAAGAINSEQAHTITSMIRRLPSKATAEQRAWGEAFLLEHAAVLNAADLAALAKRLDAAIDPDGTLPREDTAFERRAANIRNHHDGTQSLSWRDTDESIARLKAMLFPLAAPAPAEDGTKDERSGEQRRADAMGQLLHLATGHPDVPTARGERPRLVITATPTTLRTGEGFARDLHRGGPPRLRAAPPRLRRRRLRPAHDRTRRPAQTRPAPPHRLPGPMDRPRRARRRLPNARLHPARGVLRSASPHTLGRSRLHRRRQPRPVLRPPSPPPPRPRLGRFPRRRPKNLAPATRMDRPGANPRPQHLLGHPAGRPRPSLALAASPQGSRT
jgi:hypothetical protein